MSINQIFVGALGLVYADIFAVQHFAGRWEAAVFAALATAAAGVLVATAHRVIR